MPSFNDFKIRKLTATRSLGGAHTIELLAYVPTKTNPYEPQIDLYHDAPGRTITWPLNDSVLQRAYDDDISIDFEIAQYDEPEWYADIWVNGVVEGAPVSQSKGGIVVRDSDFPPPNRSKTKQNSFENAALRIEKFVFDRNQPGMQLQFEVKHHSTTSGHQFKKSIDPNKPPQILPFNNGYVAVIWVDEVTSGPGTNFSAEINNIPNGALGQPLAFMVLNSSQTLNAALTYWKKGMIRIDA